MSQVDDNYPKKAWSLSNVAMFRRTNDELGGFSNFAVGMPIKIHGFFFITSEHLYQAMRFPHLPDIQFEIMECDTASNCKSIAKKHLTSSREDWEEIRTDVMRWCLAKKILSNPQQMEQLFEKSAGKPIVEFSKRDDFWGASPRWEGSDELFGRNVLGCLLTEIRDEYASDRLLSNRTQPGFNRALLLGKPIKK